MELSPLAKAKLAKIGELSPEEKSKIKFSEELTSILADYFTGKMDTVELQQRLQNYNKDSNIPMIKETQSRLVQAINLGSSELDFERSRSGILSCEKLKSPNKYSDLEKNITAVKSLREKYQNERESFLNSVKNTVRRQVMQRVQEMANQGRNMSVDIESSVAASAKSTTQWRDFVIKHEKTYGQLFDDAIAKIASLL